MKNIKRKDLIVFGKKFKNGLRKMLNVRVGDEDGG